MATKETPTVKELRNAGKRLFIEFVGADELMGTLRVAPAETMKQLGIDPEAWGTIRPSLYPALRKRNYLRFLDACRAYVAEVSPGDQ